MGKDEDLIRAKRQAFAWGQGLILMRYSPRRYVVERMCSYELRVEGENQYVYISSERAYGPETLAKCWEYLKGVMDKLPEELRFL